MVCIDENDILIGIIILLVGLAVGVFISATVQVFDAGDGEIVFGDGERFVRVDAEPVEDWCEEWVCEDYELVRGEACGFECYYHGERLIQCVDGGVFNSFNDSECELVGEYPNFKRCVSESFVRRRC